MEVRNIKSDELDKLISLYQHLHPQDATASKEALEKTWQTIQEHPSLFRYFVIEKEDQIIASCNLSLIPNFTRGARPIGLIENVVTHADFRNQGLGKTIIKHAVSVARENNCYKVMLLSDIKRTDSHHFYRKLGFNGDSKKGFVLRMED